MKASRSALSRPIIYDEALITSLCRYSESDCIVRLFTREHGRINAFYRRGLLRKRGSSPIHAPGFAAVGFLPGTDRLAHLNSADMDPRCFFISSSLKIFSYCAYLSELIEKLLPEHDPAPAVFSLLNEAIAALESQGAQAGILRGFELKLLDNLGFLPAIPLSDQDCYFDPISCSFARKGPPHSFFVSAYALKMAFDLLNCSLNSQQIYAEAELLTIGKIIYSRFKVLGIMPLKSINFFKQLRLSQK